MSMKIREQIGQIWQRVKPVLQEEVGVVLLGAATFAGAASFLLVVQKFWDLELDDWWLLALAIALSALPKIFNRVRRSKAPVLIKAAIAYSEGFLSVTKLSPNIIQLGAKIKAWLISHKGDESDV